MKKMGLMAVAVGMSLVFAFSSSVFAANYPDHNTFHLSVYGPYLIHIYAETAEYDYDDPYIDYDCETTASSVNFLDYTDNIPYLQVGYFFGGGHEAGLKMRIESTSQEQKYDPEGDYDNATYKETRSDIQFLPYYTYYFKAGEYIMPFVGGFFGIGMGMIETKEDEGDGNADSRQSMAGFAVGGKAGMSYFPWEHFSIDVGGELLLGFWEGELSKDNSSDIDADVKATSFEFMAFVGLSLWF